MQAKRQKENSTKGTKKDFLSQIEQHSKLVAQISIDHKPPPPASSSSIGFLSPTKNNLENFSFSSDTNPFKTNHSAGHLRANDLTAFAVESLKINSKTFGKLPVFVKKEENGEINEINYKHPEEISFVKNYCFSEPNHYDSLPFGKQSKEKKCKKDEETVKNENFFYTNASEQSINDGLLQGKTQIYTKNIQHKNPQERKILSKLKKGELFEEQADYKEPSISKSSDYSSDTAFVASPSEHKDLFYASNHTNTASTIHTPISNNTKVTKPYKTNSPAVNDIDQKILIYDKIQNNLTDNEKRECCGSCNENKLIETACMKSPKKIEKVRVEDLVKEQPIKYLVSDSAKKQSTLDEKQNNLIGNKKEKTSICSANDYVPNDDSIVYNVLYDHSLGEDCKNKNKNKNIDELDVEKIIKPTKTNNAKKNFIFEQMSLNKIDINTYGNNKIKNGTKDINTKPSNNESFLFSDDSNSDKLERYNYGGPGNENFSQNKPSENNPFLIKNNIKFNEIFLNQFLLNKNETSNQSTKRSNEFEDNNQLNINDDQQLLCDNVFEEIAENNEEQWQLSDDAKDEDVEVDWQKRCVEMEKVLNEFQKKAAKARYLFKEKVLMAIIS